MATNKAGWVQSIHGFEYFRYGEHALLLQWPPSKSLETLDKVTAVQSFLTNQDFLPVIDLVPAFHSLVVYFSPRDTKHSEIIELLESQRKFEKIEYGPSEPIEIEVKYDLEEALDLKDVSIALSLSVDEIIELHTSAIYHVHFIGFLPGFLYLGGLNDRLYIPRKSKPRIRVPAGSVAIANGQTGIYPIDSPGGWHLIGKTDEELFNPYNYPPCPFKAGMQIKFKAI